MAAKKSTGKTSGEIQEVAEKVVKKKRAARPQQQPQLEPGDSRKFINNSMRIFNLSKIDINNAEQVKSRVQEYFDICGEDDVKPSVAGLALALDIDRTYLWQITAGKTGKNADVVDTLKKAMKLLDLQMTNYMQNGKINPVSGIFLMKNNFGYADKQEVVVTPNNPLGDGQDEKQLEEKYQNSVIIDAEAQEIE